MSDFAKILKATLDERGINQNWLAEAAGTKEATISRYVTGVNKSPNVDILVNVAKALNVSTDYLLGLTDVPNHNSKISAEERVMLSAYRRISDRDATLIWSILEDYMTPNEKGLIHTIAQDEKQEKIG